MAKRITIAALLAAAGVVVGGCSVPGKADTRESGKPAVAVEVQTLAAADLSESIAVVGSLAPKLTADLRSEVTAIVDEVYVSEWVRVRKGEPLARLNTRDAEGTLAAAKAALAQAAAAESRALRELGRAEKLKQAGLLTQQGLDDARSAQEATLAAAAVAKAQLSLAETNLAKTTIRAPFDGVVASRGVSVGDRVESMGGDAMFRVVDNRILQLTVNVPSTQSARVKVGQPLTFTVDALAGKQFAGKIMYINPAVDATTRTVKVIADVPNDGGELRGGMFAEGQIVTGVRTGVLQVPRVALLTWDVERHAGEVLVANGDKAERRAVELGDATGEFVVVVRGLAAGEKVITRGGFNVRPGDRVQVTGAQGA
jgi:membrane fusion protein, multidrug efflux system